MRTLLLILLLVPMMSFGQSKKKQIEALNFSLDSLNTLLSNTRTNSAKETKELNNSINNLNKEKEKLNLTIESLNVTNDKLTTETYQLNKKIGVLNNSLDSINNVLSISRENSNNEVNQLNISIEQLNSKIEVLKTDNNLSSSAIKTLIKENDKLKKDLEELSKNSMVLEGNFNAESHIDSFREIAAKATESSETIDEWMSNFNLISSLVYDMATPEEREGEFVCDYCLLLNVKYFKEGIIWYNYNPYHEGSNFEIHFLGLSLSVVKKYIEKYNPKEFDDCSGEWMEFKYKETNIGIIVSMEFAC